MDHPGDGAVGQAHETQSLGLIYGYEDGWGELGPDLVEEITRMMHPHATFDEPTSS